MSGLLNQNAAKYEAAGVKVLYVLAMIGNTPTNSAYCSNFKQSFPNLTTICDTVYPADSVHNALGFANEYCYFAVNGDFKVVLSWCGVGDAVTSLSTQQALLSVLDTLAQ